MVDDRSVWVDGADTDGTGGTAYEAYVLSAQFDDQPAVSYGTLRRLEQEVPHDGAVTVTMTPYQDGNALTGQALDTTLGAMRPW